MLEYYKLFNDYLQLRAYISGINASLDSEAELDIFIRNCKHSAYLNRVTHDERRIVSLRHKYTGQQLVETLDKYLMARDSPARIDLRETRRATPPSTVGKIIKPFRKMMQTTAVNAIATDTSRETDSDEDVVEPPDVSLYKIDVPEDSTSKSVCHTYAAAVHQLSAKPSLATEPDCIVCGQKQRFDKCPTLQKV